MNPKYYKYATIGLASFIGLCVLSYVVVVTPVFMNTIDNSEPHTLENIPDTWGVAVWRHEQTQATYNSNLEDCTLDMTKYGVDRSGMNFTMVVMCGFEKGGESYMNFDMESVRVVTEPNDFDFHLPGVESCGLHIDYGIARNGHGDEVLDAGVYCHNIRD